jgi:ATP-dependent helicase/nuclease subunit A
VEEGGSLADAADSLEADTEALNEVESLPLEPGRTDVVRVMNLHKAKGLEADVVFLADPAGGPYEHIDVHIERTGLKGQGWFKLVRKIEGQFGGKLLGEHVDWAVHEVAERPYCRPRGIGFCMGPPLAHGRCWSSVGRPTNRDLRHGVF